MLHVKWLAEQSGASSTRVETGTHQSTRIITSRKLIKERVANSFIADVTSLRKVDSLRVHPKSSKGPKSRLEQAAPMPARLGHGDFLRFRFYFHSEWFSTKSRSRDWDLGRFVRSCGNKTKRAPLRVIRGFVRYQVHSSTLAWVCLWLRD